MVTPIFKGIVENGRLRLLDPEVFKDYIASFFKEKKEVSVWVKPKRKLRTTGKPDEASNQNGYYWVAVVRIPADHFGYTDKEMHDAFRYMFLRKEEQGKPPTLGTTTVMNTQEFAEYVEKCRRWCAEQGLVIPNPGEIVL